MVNTKGKYHPYLKLEEPYPRLCFNINYHTAGRDIKLYQSLKLISKAYKEGQTSDGFYSTGHGTAMVNKGGTQENGNFEHTFS